MCMIEKYIQRFCGKFLEVYDMCLNYRYIVGIREVCIRPWRMYRAQDMDMMVNLF